MTALEERLKRRMKSEPIRIVYADERIQRVLYPDGLLLQTNVSKDTTIAILFKRKVE